MEPENRAGALQEATEPENRAGALEEIMESDNRAGDTRDTSLPSINRLSGVSFISSWRERLYSISAHAWNHKGKIPKEPEKNIHRKDAKDATAFACYGASRLSNI